MTETAQTIKDSLDVITPYLQSLADKLDTTASYLWAIQIKQAYVVAITDILILLLWILISIAIYKLSLIFTHKVNIQEHGKDVDDFCTLGFIYICVGVPIGCGLVFFIHNFNEILTCLFNPEYYALQQLINMFK